MEHLQIKIKIKEASVELTLNEARALYEELGTLFGKVQPVQDMHKWPIPNTTPPVPSRPTWPAWTAWTGWL